MSFYIEIIFIYITIIVVVCFAKYEFNKIRKRYKINKQKIEEDKKELERIKELIRRKLEIK